MAWFGHVWILFIQLVIWGGLIALVIWVVRRFSASRQPDKALSILNERFARGEIDQQEYEQRKTTLLKR
jgi:putative membrane protein